MPFYPQPFDQPGEGVTFEAELTGKIVGLDLAMIDLENGRLSIEQKLINEREYVAWLRMKGVGGIVLVEDGLFQDRDAAKDGFGHFPGRGDPWHYRKVLAPRRALDRDRISQADHRRRYWPGYTLEELRERRREFFEDVEGLMLIDDIVEGEAEMFLACGAAANHVRSRRVSG